jgi:UDP-N-acetyl-D-mannosaminuronic acid dehydrogenase
VPAEQAIREADLIFIGAPHAAYRSLDFAGKPVVDIWNLSGQRLGVV